jgi:hypothetical protein
MKSTVFIISRFVNRNGITSWRVSGWLHGIRIRKNFRTREEAIAEKGALDLRSILADAGLRPATTFLEPDQLREAEARRCTSQHIDAGLGNERKSLGGFDSRLSHHDKPGLVQRLGTLGRMGWLG